MVWSISRYRWPSFWLSLAGATIGLFSGTLIARFGLPAFVVTLGVMAIGRSLAYIFSGATAIADLPEKFGDIVYTSVLGVPANVLTLLVLYGLAWAYLNLTKGGTHHLRDRL